MVLAALEAGLSRHFTFHPERLDEAAGLVVQVTRERYPDLAIPLHSRWRHFAPGGRDRFAELRSQLDHLDSDELARVRFDLVIVSVLLDAGAGDAWRWREPATSETFARSEGLALASLHLFERGLLSDHRTRPLRADAAALRALDAGALAEVFQVRHDNPLAGLEGRVLLLNRLGTAIELDPKSFGSPARLGHLYDLLKDRAIEGRLPAPVVLEVLLDKLAAIWPGRLAVGEHNLGDVGRHPAARAEGPGNALVPFHKLSQWLAYSLVEPLHEARLEVTQLDGLTALAEYRNGGLLIDTGVLAPRDPAALDLEHDAMGELAVEWRALTVALIDRLAQRVRHMLGRTATELPLPKVLEGGTWAAGRRVAAAKRAGGGPPLRIVSDGTLF